MTNPKYPKTWRGYYRKRHEDERSEMNMTLQFQDGAITGEGEDASGEFRIEGRFDPETGEVRFTKMYADHRINYRGFQDQSNKIWGVWEPPSREYAVGYFSVWPYRENDPVDISSLSQTDEPAFHTAEARILLERNKQPRRTDLQERAKIFRVDPKLAGRCGPSNIPFDLDRLKHREDIDAIVSLQEVSDERIEQWRAAGLDVKTLFFRMGSLNDENDVEAFIEGSVTTALEYIDEQHSQGNHVLVHCYAGLDRTGAVLACWLIKATNCTPEDAIEEVKNVRPRAFVTDGYTQAVIRYEEKM